MDLDGFYPEGLIYAWDTTSRKDSDIVRKQMLVMNKIARKGLLRSGKDISNPGTLGTTGYAIGDQRQGGERRCGQDPTTPGRGFPSMVEILSGMRLHAHL